MKTIGILGGMSWESTQSYYRAINEEVRARRGGLSSARVVLWSLDFEEIAELQRRGGWERLGEILGEAGAGLRAAGADFLLIATNTMHKVAEAVEERAGIPVMHIADATGERIVGEGFRKVGLLGTRFTMEQDFYRARLAERFGLEVMTPRESERAQVHRIIFDELCRGTTLAGSRAVYRGIMEGLAARGAEGIILGCTEISLLVTPEDSPVPLFDTTAIHAEAAVARALEG